MEWINTSGATATIVGSSNLTKAGSAQPGVTSASSTGSAANFWDTIYTIQPGAFLGVYQKLSTKDGAAFGADGRLGLLRVEYRPGQREVDIDHAPMPGQNDGSLARHFTIEGLAEAPHVVLNGKPVETARDGKIFRVAL